MLAITVHEFGGRGPGRRRDRDRVVGGGHTRGKLSLIVDDDLAAAQEV